MNTELGKNGKNHFEKDNFKLMNNAVLGKIQKIYEKLQYKTCNKGRKNK